MKRYGIRHEGASSGAQPSLWLVGWRAACQELERYLAADSMGLLDDQPARVVRDRMEVLLRASAITLVRTLEGREN